MRHPSRFWADLTTLDFARLQASAAAADLVAVLPLGATEQHGPHLPLCVDTTLADGVIAACLPHLPETLAALFLPTQSVGKSNEHQRFPGTLTLSAETTMRLWTEIGESVARAGVRKLVLFNAHGGHVGLMDVVARELRTRCDMMVWSINWFGLPLGDAVQGLFDAREHRFGIHAGDIETSMMLSLRPALVDMAQARDFRSSSQDRAERFAILGNGSSAKLGWQMQDYNAMGAAGNAAAATPEKGLAVIEAAGFQLAQALQEIAQLPLSTLVDRPDLPV
ncbi:creatininase family protein [Ramlibacter rhizophilus]|uniref:Creatininase family protein n=1 Tax=Ramlibacter rhizophilus TaxID=1781167 RepID=A0A4Z0BD91_9BURK|nr:creatininase family protein [Ramlibacter rhizophilus]TFY96277.1 creatininase family protein [Ramlibacter rhizophilus]